ncbi:helix-turn-helix domain-containing protein [Kordiimonas gwangyangensis]|uniref:helix-turn-helix domain-containing protein n=1 Tax=Kordiimonas gwangyangensis TaxID=288022 RepID=UPI000378DA6C|nr:helix-turn-helix transcriptional regulator [Kordiimonas gwangyangensis]
MGRKIDENEEHLLDLSARKADLIDKHVGRRLRDRRRTLDLSQQDIANILGISYQQVQKYESGLNRISAGRLYLLAHIMHTNVGYFYEGLPSGDEILSGKITEMDLIIPELDTLPNANVRDALSDLVRAIKESKMLS